MSALRQTLRWTSSDLEMFPDDGNLREIIDGDLYVSKQPHYYHQTVCAQVTGALVAWNNASKAGQVSIAPGVIFADDDDVAPDVVWTSHQRLSAALSPDGKLHAAPDLVVEVLSHGGRNEFRDKEAKRRLYSRRGVLEYWIVDWRTRQIEVYRRVRRELQLVLTLLNNDTLTSPHLLGFQCGVETFFQDIQSAKQT